LTCRPIPRRNDTAGLVWPDASGWSGVAWVPKGGSGDEARSGAVTPNRLSYRSQVAARVEGRGVSRIFFHPAIALMNRLTYPQKFALISLLFALPLTLVLVLLISESR